MQINHWDRLGIAKPSVRAAEGHGSRRFYSMDDLTAVEIAHQLRTVNISLECLAAAMSQLRAIWPSPTKIAAGMVVLIGPDGSCKVVAEGADPATLLSGYRAGILLDLAGVIRELRARLPSAPAAELPKPTAEPLPHIRHSRACAWGADW